jgi:hypothetical protein
LAFIKLIKHYKIHIKAKLNSKFKSIIRKRGEYIIGTLKGSKIDSI